MAIDREAAIAILNEAKSGGWEDQPFPDDDQKLIERAEYFYSHAKQGFEEGMRDPEIQAIIWIGDSANTGKADSKIEDSYPRRSSGGLSESDEREIDSYPTDEDVEKKVERVEELNQRGTPGFKMMVEEHLPIPSHIEGDPDPMPRDLSTPGDKEIRKLTGEYNAYFARVTYLLGIESSDLANAEHLLEAERAKVLRGLDLIDPNSDGKKQKLAKLIDSEVLGDKGVAELTAAVAKHQQMVIVLKSLKEIYSSNVDRLSREWTMRQNEWEKSR